MDAYVCMRARMCRVCMWPMRVTYTVEGMYGRRARRGPDWNNTFMFNRNRGACPTTTRNHPPISEINLLINIPSLREYHVREIDEPHIDRIYISTFYSFLLLPLFFLFFFFFSFFPLPPISTFVVLTALLYGRSLVKRTFLLAKSFATATYYHAS